MNIIQLINLCLQKHITSISPNTVVTGTITVKTEFVKGHCFDSLEELTRKLHDYVHWFNHIRIHGTLGYLSPIEYKLEHLKKVV
jgi:transposase InsO family protein